MSEREPVEPGDVEKQAARDWALSVVENLPQGKGIALTNGAWEELQRVLASEVLPLLQAKEEAQRKHKTLAEAVNCGSKTCDDKPGSTCDSYGHDEDCPYVEDAITLMRLAGDVKAARESERVAWEQGEKLREASEEVVRWMRDSDGLWLPLGYAPREIGAIVEGNNVQAIAHKRLAVLAAALSSFAARKKEAGR